MKALEAASALLLGIAATGTIVWYAAVARPPAAGPVHGSAGPIVTAHRALRDLQLAVMLAAAPLVIAVADPAEDIDRIGAAVLLVVIALAWGVVARRSAAPPLLTPFARTCTTMYGHAHGREEARRRRRRQRVRRR